MKKLFLVVVDDADSVWVIRVFKTYDIAATYAAQDKRFRIEEVNYE